MRLILFDIDGTLVDTGGAGTRSLNNAFLDLFSLEDAFHGIRLAGKTDPEIIKEALLEHEISIDGNLDAVVNSYLKNLEKEIQNNRKHLKPGISELLEHLSAKGDAGVGLLTGNIEPGARIKLESFNLNRYFSSGAFGSDDDDRNNLLPIAVRRFEALFQKRIEIDNCIIVGDTPRDVACAHIYNALCIGVATGPYSFEDLVEAGADIVVKDLSSHSELLGIF
jgi:phosphoglycolate phosphatase-like HAD superfamily hydrolase